MFEIIDRNHQFVPAHLQGTVRPFYKTNCIFFLIIGPTACQLNSITGGQIGSGKIEPGVNIIIIRNVEAGFCQRRCKPYMLAGLCCGCPKWLRCQLQCSILNLIPCSFQRNLFFNRAAGIRIRDLRFLHCIHYADCTRLDGCFGAQYNADVVHCTLNPPLICYIGKAA